LGEEYPGRIAKVRGEIAEVDKQIEQFNEDSEVAHRVVAMTTNDLSELRTLITRAEQVTDRPVFIRFEGIRFDHNQAMNEVKHIRQIRMNYGDRLAVNTQQLDVLHQQKTRLHEILNKLEDEYSTFQTQMWQLDRQIDAIERNDRLIEMTKQLQATLSSYDRWGQVGNLKQVESKLAELRSIQDAQLEALARQGYRGGYEERARFEMNDIEPGQDPFEEIFQDLEELPSEDEEVSAESFAFSGPVIVE
jgi:phage shock protein A